MGTKFEPNEADLRETVRALERAEKKWKSWLDEGERYNGLYVNDIETANRVAPGGDAENAGRANTAAIVRNGIGFAVRAAIRRKSIKYPKIEAEPLDSAIMKKMPDGSEIIIEGSYAAYAQAECATYIVKKIRLSEEMIPVLEQGETYHEGWLKLVHPSGGDAPETQAWVYEGEESESETSIRKIRTHRPVSSLANFRYGAAVFVSCEDVIPDADAKRPSEINRITHRCVKPLSQMRDAEIEDYEVYINESGRLASRAVLDEEGNPVIRKKYRNLENMKGNYSAYLSNRASRGGKKPYRDGDIRNEHDEEMTGFDPQDGLVFFEENGRFPADSKVVIDEFGGVPRTYDGFVYFLKVYVENTDGDSDEAPTLIRFDWYPADIGGFYLKRYDPFPKAGSLRSSSWIRDAYEAQAMETYWDSWLAAWYAAYKPVTLWNKSVVDEKTVVSIQNGEHFDNIIVDVPVGQDLKNARLITNFQEAPQGVSMLQMRMRAVQDEASGASANQRLQSSGDIPATQSNIISENANEQLGFDIERVKDFAEDVVRGLIRMFRASLPETGLYQIPGTDGAHIVFDASVLELDCEFKFTYTSWQQGGNPVETKQLADLTNKIANTPPQMIPVMAPLWEVEAARYTPAVMAAFRKSMKAAMTPQNSTDPNREHILMREGQFIDPDPMENFVITYPQHQKMLQEVMNPQSPIFEGWNTPVGKIGKTPREALSYHVEKSAQFAEARGMGPALGLTGDKAGLPRKERGSGILSGRMGQDANPSPGKMEAEAASEPSVME
jgi:hypothetical protein